jgi:hypothetical protein
MWGADDSAGDDWAAAHYPRGMPGSHWRGDDTGRPEPSEVYIVGADGGRRDIAAAATEPSWPRARRPAARSWAAFGIAGALLFALGIAIGMHLGGEPSTTAGATTTTTAGDRNPRTTGDGTAPAASTPASDVGESASSGRGAVALGPTVAATSAPGTETAGLVTSSNGPSRRPWPTVTGACGSDVTLPILTGVGDLTAQTGLRLLAGNDPRLLNVDSASGGAPLFRLGDGEFVSQIAVDDAGTVAVISDCRGYPPLRVVRRSTDGTVRTINATAPGYQVGSLIAGGNRTWLAMYHTQPDSITYQDSAVLLKATDGGSDSITLPNGFSPAAGSGDVIVGNWSDHLSSVYGPIQLYDISQRAIVAQLGDATPQYAVGNGYIIWWANDCTGRCAVHRYHVSDRRETTTIVTAQQTVAYWLAISPDGSRVAGVSYHNDPDPRFAIDHPGGPTGIAVMDLNTGTVTELPGIELAPKSTPSMVFSPDSRWLAVGINAGDSANILLFDRELRGPYDPGIRVRGPSLWTIPLAVSG